MYALDHGMIATGRGFTDLIHLGQLPCAEVYLWILSTNSKVNKFYLVVREVFLIEIYIIKTTPHKLFNHKAYYSYDAHHKRMCASRIRYISLMFSITMR